MWYIVTYFSASEKLSEQTAAISEPGKNAGNHHVANCLLALNPGFQFRISSCSFGEKSVFSKAVRRNPELKAWARG